MKNILLLLIIGVFFANFDLSAQIDQKDFYSSKATKYKKLRNSGIILTIGGAVITTVGIAALANSDYDPYSYSSDIDGNYAIGIIGTSLGAAAMAGGITMWAIGANKSKYYQQKLNKISLNLKPNPKQVISLTYSF